MVKQMIYWWDKCNKWLYVGSGIGQNKRWIIMFSEWSWFPLNKLAIRSWSLFKITWDNGAWWAFDMDNAINLNGRKNGYLNAFFEIVILGIGIRMCYSRHVVMEEKMNLGLNK